MERPPLKADPSGAALPFDGKVDPARLDVTAKPKRKRKARNRPDPRPDLKASGAAMEKRAIARPIPPGVVLEPAGFDQEYWTAPHSDRDLWTLQLAEAFGTRSQAVIVTFMGQLEHLCDKSFWDDETKQWRLDENTFSAALAIVNAAKPRNELEACLAAQMVAVHMLAMRTSAHALKYEGDAKTAAVAGKLARTFAMQMEALDRLRKPNRTARQNIKVTKETHQHVHLHHTGGEAGTGGQPQGAIVGTSEAMQGPQPGGTVLRLPGGAWEERLPVPRRKVAGGTKGEG